MIKGAHNDMKHRHVTKAMLLYINNESQLDIHLVTDP